MGVPDLRALGAHAKFWNPTTTPSGVLGMAVGSVWLYCRLSLVILPVESGYKAVESGYIAG